MSNKNFNIAVDSNTYFFEAIRNSNIGEVVKIFRKESEQPWEFKQKDSGFNGKKYKKATYYKKATTNNYNIIKLINISTNNFS